MSEAVATDLVLTALESGVVWIRLNRPESMNAINADLRRALAAAVRDAERNPDVKVVVVIGTGRAFCAGADVNELATRQGALEEMSGDYERIMAGLRNMPKPTIAALNGVAAGIGASIALACDLRFATEDAALVEAFTMALAAAKRSVNFGANATFEETMDFEFLLQSVQMQGEDFKEGVAAFLENRKPQFKGE